MSKKLNKLSKSVLSEKQIDTLEELINEIDELNDMFIEVGDNEPSRASLMYKSGQAEAKLLIIRNRLKDLASKLSGEGTIIW
jgi:hypothetical protein